MDEQERVRAGKIERWLENSRVKRAVTFIALFIGVSPFLALALNAYPYTPFSSYEYASVPDTACAGEAVSIFVEREFRSEAGDLRYIRVNARWTSPGNEPVSLPSVEIPQEDVRDGRNDATAVIASTPSQPGKWTLEAEVTAAGNLFGIPVLPVDGTDDVRSEEILTVLPDDNPNCTGVDEESGIQLEHVEEVTLSLSR